jgi:hypothetical protein
VPAAFLSFVYGRRLPYDVPAPVVATAGFLGGVIGTVVAGTLEYDAQRDLGFLPMVGVGLIEETSKLLIPLAVLLSCPIAGRCTVPRWSSCPGCAAPTFRPTCAPRHRAWRGSGTSAGGQGWSSACGR